jgi:hypothetical protein
MCVNLTVRRELMVGAGKEDNDGIVRRNKEAKDLRHNIAPRRR